MEQFFVDYLDRLQDLHKQIHEVLDGLSDTAVNWHPGDDMNSIAVLVAHSMGAERFWIGDVGLGELSDRVRSAEFEVSGTTCAELKNLLEQTYQYIETALPKISVSDLATTKTSPNHAREFTVGWSLLHALEHTAVHVGHMQIVKQMWQMR